MRKLVIGSSVFMDPHFRIMYDEVESQSLDGHEVVLASCDGACGACVANPHAGRVQCRSFESTSHTTSDVGQGWRILPLVDCKDDFRRQEDSAVYELNGAIYINSWDEITLALKACCNPFGYTMDAACSVGVDEGCDFELAERLLQKC